MSLVEKPTVYISLGIATVMKTPKIWKMIICPLILSGIFGLAVLIVLFSAAYVPQAQALENAGIASGWAYFLAFLFVILEIVLLTLIFILVVYGQLKQNIFDKVYMDNASEEAKASMKLNEEGCLTACCKECATCGRLLWFSLFLMVITLPLLFIPILGSLCFAYINGVFFAWDLHADYFVSQGITDFVSQKKIVKSDSFYHTFGMSALFLETLPLVGTFFVFSNAAGAALYAAKHEPAMKFRQNQGLSIAMATA